MRNVPGRCFNVILFDFQLFLLAGGDLTKAANKLHVILAGFKIILKNHCDGDKLDILVSGFEAIQ